jgi:hypothetical protein
VTFGDMRLSASRLTALVTDTRRSNRAAVTADGPVPTSVTFPASSIV